MYACHRGLTKKGKRRKGEERERHVCHNCVTNKMCQVIQHAVNTVLPEWTRQGGLKREVSERTKSLHDESSRNLARTNPREGRQEAPGGHEAEG